MPSLLFNYLKNVNSNRLPYPSSIRKGWMPLDWSKMPMSTVVQSISTDNSDVILPYSEQQQKVGTVFPLKLSLPTQGVDAFNPKTPLVHISLAENIIAHMTGLPIAARFPYIVLYLNTTIWASLCRGWKLTHLLVQSDIIGSQQLFGGNKLYCLMILSGSTRRGIRGMYLNRSIGMPRKHP